MIDDYRTKASKGDIEILALAVVIPSKESLKMLEQTKMENPRLKKELILSIKEEAQKPREERYIPRRLWRMDRYDLGDSCKPNLRGIIEVPDYDPEFS